MNYSNLQRAGVILYLTALIFGAYIAFVCYLLDLRTTNLLHDCRVAIRKLESEHMNEYADEYKLFSNIKKNEGVFNYSKVIRGILHMARPNGRFCGAKRPKCEAEQPLGFD